MLDTAERLARFLVALEYTEPAVKQAVRGSFPDADLESVYAEAVAHHARCEAQLDAAIEKETTAARAAEHDLTKTMHIDHRRSE